MALEIDGDTQQAPQPGRQFMRRLARRAAPRTGTVAPAFGTAGQALGARAAAT
jgi:hypothetical protein